MLNSEERFFKIKEQFLSENNLKEIEIENKVSSNCDISTIDEENEEIWLLQCSKNLNITQLIGQKLKFPGRTNLQKIELLSSAFNVQKMQAFGYSKHGKYKVRLLPINGNIIVRESLKDKSDITEEKIEASCRNIGRATMPDYVKIRHPLFGQTFKRALKVNAKVQERLNQADVNSKEITAKLRSKSMRKLGKRKEKHTENNLIIKKSKRSIKEEPCEEIYNVLNKEIKEEISEDLEWLRNV